MSDIERTEDYFKQRDEQYVQLARETGDLADLCRHTDYHPDHGRVPEYWEPLYPQFFEKARQLGANQTAGAAATSDPDDDAPDSRVQDPQYTEAEERLAALLGWEEQPMRQGELFHRWKSPDGTILQGRPYWARDNGDAFKLAADLEISTAYLRAHAIATYEPKNGQVLSVREKIKNHPNKLAAMRLAITEAASDKIEFFLAAKPASTSGPGIGP